jgi:hypothetical protein
MFGGRETSRMASAEWASQRLLMGGSLALLLLLGTASAFLGGPQVMADEGSYLLSGALLAGQAAVDPGSGYYSGYGLLLLPAFLPHASPGGAYHLALLVNALLVASTPFALVRITRVLWPGTTPWVHAAAAVATTCHASVLLLSQFAMSDNALVPLYAWFLASAAILLARHRAVPAIACGALAGLLFLVHPRGAAMALPVMVVLSFPGIANPRLRALIALAWTVALLVGALHWPLEMLAGRAHGGAYSAARMLAHLRGPSGWQWFAANLAGCVTEAIVASCGLILVGIMGLRDVARRQPGNDAPGSSPAAAVLLASCAALVAALLVTAAFFIPPTRADQAAYGRYALPTVLPLVAIGMVRLMGKREAILRRLGWTLLPGLAGILVAAVAFKHLAPSAQSSWSVVNGTALHAADQLARAGSPWLVIGPCFVVALLLLGVAFRRSPGLGMATFAGFNIAAAAMAWGVTVLPGSWHYASERHVIDTATQWAVLTRHPLCLQLDRRLDAWHKADLGWRLFPLLAGTTSPSSSCTRGVIAPLTADVPHGLRTVAIERPSPLGKGRPIALLVADGPALAAYAAQRSLAPADLMPIATSDRRASVRLLAPAFPAMTVTPGKSVVLRLQVTNTSGHAWPASASIPVPFPVLVGARNAKGTGPAWQRRTRLPKGLQPGETVAVNFDVGPFTPGVHRMHIGIVQEHVAWFEGGMDLTIHATATQRAD